MSNIRVVALLWPRIVFVMLLMLALNPGPARAQPWTACEMVNRFAPGASVDVMGELLHQTAADGRRFFVLVSSDCPDRQVLLKHPARLRERLLSCTGRQTRVVATLIEDNCIPFTPICVHYVAVQKMGCS